MLPALATAEPHMARLEVGAIAGAPRNDLDDPNQFDARVSPGVNIQVGREIKPGFGWFVGVRYFKVRSDEVAMFDSSLSNYDLDVGARFAMPLGSIAQAFAEGMLMASVADFDGGDLGNSYGVGIGGRGGVSFKVGSRTVVGVATSYTSSAIGLKTYAWLGFEGFAGISF